MDPDPSTGGWYGARVSIHGDHAFVSELGPDQLSGAVHVYHRNEGGFCQWGWIQTISPPDGDGRYFGYGLLGSSERLLIFRKAHTYPMLGADVCRAETLFLYELDAGGQFVLDTALHGEIVSDVSCSVPGDCHIGVYGDVITWAFSDANDPGCTRITFETQVDGSWNEGSISNSCIGLLGAHCLKGDTVIFSNSWSGSLVLRQLVGLNAMDIGELMPMALYGAQLGHTTIAVTGDFLAVGQPGGAAMDDYSDGRVLLFDLQQSGFPLVDTLEANLPTQNFAEAIAANRNHLVVLEGGYTQQRMFIYQRSGAQLVNIAVLDDFTDYSQGGCNDLTMFNLSDHSELITSSYRGMDGFSPVCGVRIYDLSSATAVPMPGDGCMECGLSVVARNLAVNCQGCNTGEPMTIGIHDIAGRQLLMGKVLGSDPDGIDVSHLAAGPYLVRVTTPRSNWSGKVILP